MHSGITAGSSVYFQSCTVPRCGKWLWTWNRARSQCLRDPRICILTHMKPKTKTHHIQYVWSAPGAFLVHTEFYLNSPQARETALRNHVEYAYMYVSISYVLVWESLNCLFWVCFHHPSSHTCSSFMFNNTIKAYVYMIDTGQLYGVTNSEQIVVSGQIYLCASWHEWESRSD